MSKYSKSTGPSFSEKDAKEDCLKRGIKLHKSKIRPYGNHAGEERISPSQLPDFFLNDPDLLIRQTISVLDRVVRKPYSLRSMALDTYVDRTLVSVEIWSLLRSEFARTIQGENAEKELERLEAMWLSKVHPYARDPSDPKNPANDKNAAFIKKVQKDKDIKDQREDAEGVWHPALWNRIDGRSDHGSSAQAILRHVYTSQYKIGLDPKTEKPKFRFKDPQTAKGLAESRGVAIQKGTNDPRKVSKKSALQEVDWDSELSEKYFSHDIATIIYDELVRLQGEITAHSQAADMKGKTKRQRPRLEKNFFGKTLYEHFGKIAPLFNQDALKDKLFPIHDAVRIFYRKIAEGERIRRALRSGAGSELAGTSKSLSDAQKARIAAAEIGKIVPKNFTQFKTMATAKAANTNMSRYIRIGKLLVHAAEITQTNQEKLTDTFKENIEHYTTSEGQGAIKRNESFTRLWRNSVGLSMRSLKGLSDFDEAIVRDLEKPGKFTNQDLSTRSVSAKVVSNQAENSSNFIEQAALMFGTKKHGEASTNRVSFITEGDTAEQKETLWALLRIAGEIRNRTNHFTTRARISRMLKGGIVTPEENVEKDKFGSAERGDNNISTKAQDRLVRMLKFDLGLKKQLIIDELNLLNAAEFLNADQISALSQEISRPETKELVTTPKYMSLLRKVKALSEDEDNKLADALVPLAQLDLTNLSMKGASENQCRIGILRQLYNSGFLNWLGQKDKSSQALRRAIDIVTQSKKTRSEAAQTTKRQHYIYSENWLETLSDEDKDDLSEFSAKLAAISVADGQTVRNYRPQKAEQSSRSREIEELRQEIFAHLFVAYIEYYNLSWVWNFEYIAENAGELVTGDEISINDFQDVKNWRPQFYAWLYLIPTDDVALLRHQFKKTAALEAKSESTLDKDLEEILFEMNQLMALYTKVQGAGFDGNEHLTDYGIVTSIYQNETVKNPESGEKKSLFDAVFNKDNENHHASIPGTGRGLRQMLRYGHFNALKGVFEKHQVSSEEVHKFIEISSDETKRLFQDKIDAQRRVIDASKDPKFDEDELAELVAGYEKLAVETHTYNFGINSARLTEFSKLHQLMMRIIGRLTDYTLIWERDRIYSFLGMLFLQLQKDGLALTLISSKTLPLPKPLDTEAEIFGLSLPEGARDRLINAYKENYAESSTNKNQSIENKLKLGKDLEEGEYKHYLSKNLTENGFLPLWSETYGFSLGFFQLYIHLLDEPNRTLFEKHFVGVQDQNTKDKKWAAKTQRDMGKNAKIRPPFYQLGKQQIRNDFAHYNVINKTWLSDKNSRDGKEHIKHGNRARLNMSYLVNSVRSLLAYDRKLKNAVSQSIARILEEDGLYVRWEMERDRLKNARVCPVKMPQLTMVKGPTANELRFSLPKASVRYTSMVQALFNFSDSGNRKEIKIGSALKSRGPVNYPDIAYWDLNGDVPESMLYELPSMDARNRDKI